MYCRTLYLEGSVSSHSHGYGEISLSEFKFKVSFINPDR